MESGENPEQAYPYCDVDKCGNDLFKPLDNHQLGSIEYAAGHLHYKHIIVPGHTKCEAVGAALSGESDGFIKCIL